MFVGGVGGALARVWLETRFLTVAGSLAMGDVCD